MTGAKLRFWSIPRINQQSHASFPCQKLESERQKKKKNEEEEEEEKKGKKKKGVKGHLMSVYWLNFIFCISLIQVCDSLGHWILTTNFCCNL